MYAATAAPATGAGAKGALPLAAVCCLGTLCFLIAATIVLALIPIYLPNKNTQTVTSTTTSTIAPAIDDKTRWVRYRAPATAGAAGTARTGAIKNFDAAGGAVGLKTGGTVLAGQAQASIVARRKRSVLNRRQKRAVVVFFTFRVVPTFTSPCNATCQTTTLNNYLTPLNNTRVVPVVITIVSTNGEFTNTYNLVFDSILTSAPAGFNSSSTTNTTFAFTAAQSGAFNDPATWTNLIVPYGDFQITIPAGITVTIGLPALEINMQLCTISGTLNVGVAGTDQFTFNFPTTINILSGGILRIQSGLVRLAAPRGTVINRFGTGQILPDPFQLQTTVILNRRRQLSSSSSELSITGDVRTAAILPTANGGGLLAFNQTTFVSTSGGDIQNPSSYCGGQNAPTTTLCGSSCGIYLASNSKLTTSSLNGKSTLPITVITGVAGAVLELGTGSVAGFSFAVAVVIRVSGALNFVASGGGILIPPSSSFNILANAVFTAPQPTFVQVYNPATGATVGTAVQLPISMTGPLYVVASPNGTLAASTITPGANDFGNGTSTTATVSTVTVTTSTVAGAGTTTAAAAATAVVG